MSGAALDVDLFTNEERWRSIGSAIELLNRELLGVSKRHTVFRNMYDIVWVRVSIYIYICIYLHHIYRSSESVATRAAAFSMPFPLPQRNNRSEEKKAR